MIDPELVIAAAHVSPLRTYEAIDAYCSGEITEAELEAVYKEIAAQKVKE